jgi:hypothetical protein
MDKELFRLCLLFLAPSTGAVFTSNGDQSYVVMRFSPWHAELLTSRLRKKF